MNSTEKNTFAVILPLHLLLYCLHSILIMALTTPLGQNGALAVSCITLPIVYLLPSILYCKRKGIAFKNILWIENGSERTHKPSKTFLLFVFAFAMTALAVNLIGSLGDLLYFMIGGERAEHPTNSTWYAITFVRNVLIAPVIEEILFRGVVLNATDKMKESSRIFLCGLLFGLGHYSLIPFFYAFAAGIILAYFTLKMRSVLFGIAVHFAQNLLTFVFSVLVNTLDNVSYIRISYVTLTVLALVSIIGVTYIALSRKNAKIPIAGEMQEPKTSAWSEIIPYVILAAIMCIVNI